MRSWPCGMGAGLGADGTGEAKPYSTAAANKADDAAPPLFIFFPSSMANRAGPRQTRGRRAYLGWLLPVYQKIRGGQHVIAKITAAVFANDGRGRRRHRCSPTGPAGRGKSLQGDLYLQKGGKL